MKILIVGAGEVGFHIASHLSRENKDVVIIDHNVDAIRRVSDHIDVQTIIGLGSSPEVLEQAGIQEAEILLAVTNSDETNLVACMVANILSPSTKKLARVRSADYDHFNELFCNHPPHIETVINPEMELVKTIERLMSVPNATDVGEFAGGRVKFIGIRIDDGTPLAGARLLELPQRISGHRPLIFAIVRDEAIIVPSGRDRLLPGDLVYFITDDEHLGESLRHFNMHAEPIRRVLIVGGGRIAFRLARRLEERSVHVKIIEKRSDRCSLIAEKLDRTVVLCGDGSDQALLKEENIQGTDMVVTLTDDDETNILVSLLAKRLGARKTITKISKFSYFPLMHTIGIDQVVDPRLSAVNSILQHIRRGKVLSSVSIRGEDAEIMEAVALETTDIVGKPLMEISLPKGILITTILRGDKVIIPSGKSVVAPNDRIIVFARREAIPQIEKILSVKLEYF